MGCLRAICACTHILSNKILSLLLLLFHQISGSSTRSEEEVSVFRVPLRGLGMPIDDLFLHRVAHSIHVRLAQYPPGILRLVGHCMSFAWWRHFRLQLFTDVHIFSSSFRRRWNGTELQVAARIIFALLCRAVRKQIASRREQYIKRGGEPPTQEEFLWVGVGVLGQ